MLLLDLDGLLHGGHAADFRAIVVARLLVAGTDALQEDNLLRDLVHDVADPVLLDHLLQLNGGDHTFVDTVAEFLFLVRVEDSVARGQQHLVESGCLTIGGGQRPLLAGAVHGRHGTIGLKRDVLVLQLGFQLVGQLVGRAEVREEESLVADVAQRFPLFFEEGHLMLSGQHGGGLYAGGTGAYDCDIHSLGFKVQGLKFRV